MTLPSITERLGIVSLAMVIALHAQGCGTQSDIFQSPDDGSAGTDGATTLDGSTPTDSGMAQDATISLDAGPDAGVPRGDNYWVLMAANTDFVLSHDRCSVNEGSAVVLDATVHYFSSCDQPGPVEARIDHDDHSIVVQGYNWREQGRDDCVDVGAAADRTVVLHGLTQGSWLVYGASDTFTFDVVGAAPPITCTDPGPPGSACHASCDCDGGSNLCVGERVEGACGSSRCARTCSPELVSGYDGASCGMDSCERADGVGYRCGPRTRNGCDREEDCRQGMTCLGEGDSPRFCAWDTTLSASTRIECDSNEDCASGLDCVQAPSGARRCDVRCITADMACPGPGAHGCMAEGSFSDASWVCHWLGE